MSSPSSASRPRERGGSAFEALVAVSLIAILIATALSYYGKVIRAARETALQSELANIRTALVLFAAINRRFPTSLRELTDRQYLLPHEGYPLAPSESGIEKTALFKRSYLDAIALDADGRILDPFGRPYRYDPRRGQVSPVEELYAHW